MKPEEFSSKDLVGFVLRAINESSDGAREGPLAVAIGGYPYTGKTRLAHRVAATWKGPAFVLPTESVIASRSGRLALRQDGSSVESHDLTALIASIRMICDGRSLDLPEYSWLTGGFSGTIKTPVLDKRGLLLIDGSVATSSRVLSEVDAAFALQPERIEHWIELAIARDTAERHWDRITAREQNQAKSRTVAAQLTGFGSRRHEYLLNIVMDGEQEWVSYRTIIPSGGNDPDPAREIA
jgi:uridine kinase